MGPTSGPNVLDTHTHTHEYLTLPGIERRFLERSAYSTVTKPTELPGHSVSPTLHYLQSTNSTVRVHS